MTSWYFSIFYTAGGNDTKMALLGLLLLSSALDSSLYKAVINRYATQKLLMEHCFNPHAFQVYFIYCESV